MMASKGVIFDKSTAKRILAVTKSVEGYTDTSTRAGTQFKPGTGGVTYGIATPDANSSFGYPDFYSWSDLSIPYTIFPFQLGSPSFDDETTWSPILELDPQQTYVYAYNRSKHF